MHRSTGWYVLNKTHRTDRNVYCTLTTKRCVSNLWRCGGAFEHEIVCELGQLKFIAVIAGPGQRMRALARRNVPTMGVELLLSLVRNTDIPCVMGVASVAISVEMASRSGRYVF